MAGYRRKSGICAKTKDEVKRMPEWIKELLIAIGGGTTVVVVFMTVLKSLVAKIVDKAIDTSFEKSTIKLSNKLERTTKAYEILLKKEFDYYEKLDPYIAKLVPLVQDFAYWVEQYNKDDSCNAEDKYKENYLNYLEMIPNIKNDVVLYQPYIPTEVFCAVSSLLEKMQSDLEYLEFVGKVIFEIAEGKIDFKKLEEIKDNILISVAVVESHIKNRLTELSDN